MKALYIKTAFITILLSGLLPGCIPANTSIAFTPTNTPNTATPTLRGTSTFTPSPNSTSTLPVQQVISRCVQIQPNTNTNLPNGRVVMRYPDGVALFDLASQKQLYIGKDINSHLVSPDGKWLAYFDFDRNSIIIVNSNGQVVAPILNAKNLFTSSMWLDNGRVLLYKPQGKLGDPMAPLPSLVIYNPFTGEKQELLSNYPDINSDPALKWWDSHFVVNPQLTFLVYPVLADSGPLAIWDIKNGKEITRVNDASDAQPVFSPAGDQFVVPLGVRQGPFWGGDDLFLVRVDGTLTRLTYFTDTVYAEEKGYEWSPDGKQIAFLLNQSSQPYNVFSFEVLSLDTHQVINYCVNGNYVIWSPDGKYVLLDQDTASYVIRLEDGVAWKISEDASPYGWMLEPDTQIQTPTP